MLSITGAGESQVEKAVLGDIAGMAEQLEVADGPGRRRGKREVSGGGRVDHVVVVIPIAVGGMAVPRGSGGGGCGTDGGDIAQLPLLDATASAVRDHLPGGRLLGT
jgi:hypothetical protein